MQLPDEPFETINKNFRMLRNWTAGIGFVLLAVAGWSVTALVLGVGCLGIATSIKDIK